MSVYYNEWDAKSAAWIRELIRMGLIPDGEVDERSILDVDEVDLFGFDQWHFFAGIAGWPYALQMAGLEGVEGIMTGSPPCQPFSSAGQRKGKDDERHLAPKFIELVRAIRPRLLFGEQVASSAVFGKAASGARKRSGGQPEWAWLDDLQDRLEAAHYAVGASDIPAASVGAPHIRQRTFFVAVDRLADTTGRGLPNREQGGGGERISTSERGRGIKIGGGCSPCWLADTAGRCRSDEREQCRGEHGLQPKGRGAEREGCEGAQSRRFGGVADADDARSQGRSKRRDGADQRAARSPGLDGGMGHADGGGSTQERESDDVVHGQRAPFGRGQFVGAGTGAAGRDGRGDGTCGVDGGENGGDTRAPGGDTARRMSTAGRPGPTNGFWADADWLFCRDGKWRPVKSSVQCVADGVSGGVVPGSDICSAAYPLAKEAEARVMRLKGYGNAIVPQAAAVFVESVMDALFMEN